MIQVENVSPDIAESLCRKITSHLPEYFGLPDANEHYAVGVRTRINIAAKIGDDYIGLISIDFPYPNNSNIYWIAVLPHYHSQGVGHKLIETAISLAKERGATTMTVETLAPFESDENYLKTYNFYLSQGFVPLFNLKPQGYEWNMVYMIKTLTMTSSIRPDVNIRRLSKSDIPILVEAFAQWPKPAALFETYYQEQATRLVWVAHKSNQFAGYVTLKWKSQYEPFAKENIPEIMDLNVLPKYRNLGIGSQLLEVAEKEASTKSDTVGLGVGLYQDYGAAQKLYVKRGYIPDGKGVTYNYQPIMPGNRVQLDDDFILWFTKKLR